MNRLCGKRYVGAEIVLQSRRASEDVKDGGLLLDKQIKFANWIRTRDLWDHLVCSSQLRDKRRRDRCTWNSVVFLWWNGIGVRAIVGRHQWQFERVDLESMYFQSYWTKRIYLSKSGAILSDRGSKGRPPDFSVTNFRCHEWPGGSNWQYINNSK